MKSIKLLDYDSFTTIPDKGDPAGIVLKGKPQTRSRNEQRRQNKSPSYEK